MYSDDDSQTTLSKWPFILGDVLLVATALAIAVLGQWQLSNWQVAACVISVALGASLFVLPYIVEFQVRIREEREDRTADLRVLHRQLDVLSGEVEGLSQQNRQLAGELRDSTQSSNEPDPRVALLEQQLESAVQAQEAQAAALKALEDTLKQQPDQAEALVALKAELQAELQAELNSLRESSTPSVDPAVLAGLQAEVAGLKQVQASPFTGQSPAGAAPEAPVAEAAKKPTKKRPSRHPRQRRSPESGLLKRAILEKQDKSTSAVSRIIEAKGKPKPQVKTISEPAVEAEAKVEVVEEASVSEKPEVIVADQPKPAPESRSEAPAKEEPESKPAPVTLEGTQKESKAELPQSIEEAAPETAVDDMFAESVPVEVKKRVRAKKDDSVILASVFIGIGNKPYLRGSAAGLSWESGQPMEFEEIGKWRWVAPQELTDSVEIQLFRNDQDPDTGGKYTLEPGQKLKIAPVF